MNAIALFLMLVLQGNPTCPAEEPNQETIEGQPFQIDVYHCYWRGNEQPSHQFIVVSPVCPTYVAQPILVKEQHERKGWALNQFGEFHPATVNIELMDIYRPPC